MQIRTRKFQATLLALGLLVVMAGCKKKAPIAAPPPPTPAPTNEVPPPPPAAAVRINNFSAEPLSIERGQASTLRWSVANATDISINENLGAVQANGSRQVFPGQTTSYSLTARGPNGSDTRTVTVEVSTPTAAPPPPPPAPALSGTELLSREAQDAYFEYDSSEIKGDAQTALSHDADLLKRIFAADPSFSVIIEGNCDERGSAEYNLGLGDRRATSAKEYLQQLGVPADRMKTISYGKEKPVCTDATEACYQRNRRAHLATAQ